MIRRMIEINEALCNGCGACVIGCHEGAIALVNGKAKLIRDDYCDGLGDCLPTCPTKAISFIERDALAYDEKAVQAHKQEKQTRAILPCGCDGNHALEFPRVEHSNTLEEVQSALGQWPVQLKLVSPQAPYLKKANLLIAADCCAYAYGNFHMKFMKNKVTLIGCPKLDMEDYSQKIREIIKFNEIASICVVRMEVPCCKGIEHAVELARKQSGKNIPCEIITISTDGKIFG